MQELEDEAEERRRFLGAVGTAEKGEGGCTVAQSGFVDGETLFFPVVGFGDAITDRFFKEVRRVDVVDCSARVAAIVKEAFGVRLMGHCQRTDRGKSIGKPDKVSLWLLI